MNKRNDGSICYDLRCGPVFMSEKFLATMTVLGVMSSEGDVTPPLFFEKGLRVNDDVYIYVMNAEVKQWMEAIDRDRLYIFLQVGDPALYANKTKA